MINIMKSFENSLLMMCVNCVGNMQFMNSEYINTNMYRDNKAL